MNEDIGYNITLGRIRTNIDNNESHNSDVEDKYVANTFMVESSPAVTTP